MKVRIQGRNNQKARNGYLVERGLRSIKFVNGWNLAVRSVSVLLMTALLLPLIFFGQAQTTAAQTPSIANRFPAPVSAPPAEPFVYSSPSSNPLSGSLTNTTLSTAVSLNTHLADGYRFMAGIFTTPTLPEGFAMAKVPTFWKRASTSLAPSISSLTSFIAPLVFVSPNGSSPASKAKTDKAETTIVVTTEAEMDETTSEEESSVEPIAPAAPLPFAQGTTNFDFDGDGKADASRWQPTSGEWKIKNSSSGTFTTVSLGTGTAAAPADYDGDGITDLAIFTDYARTWTIKNSSNIPDQNINFFGQPGDKVVSGDYVGNAKADIAVFRPSNGTWEVREAETGTITTRQFGQEGDIPVPGNYDGDSKMDYAVFRASTATWYVLLSASSYSFTYLQWGAGTDTPVPADYDGDGKTDFAVYRPSNGTWYVYKSSTNDGSYLSKTWGNYGDQPAPANYDGDTDGKADFAVWRPTTGVWYIVKSSDPTFNTYEYHQLGIVGDTAVPSAYLKQIGGQVLTYNLANARLAPKNQTGGTDLYSRNFGWGTGLVGLPGRAGLDAGFGISYNSLVWTKEPTSNTMVFDADNSNVSPGFRFGFPTIEPSYYNGLTQKYSYLMVTPSGGRVEFRQDAASGIYETVDSSYTQLSVDVGGPNQAVEDKTLTVKTTDGTQMKYGWKAGAYRLNQIKDRNGNFITVVHDSEYGLLQSVTDTLGRVITVQYDSEFYPTTIKQEWKAGNGEGTAFQHTYATFSYTLTPITPNFATGIGVFGPSGGTNIKVLQQITYPAGNSTTFQYNNYGQVWKIRNVAADSSEHELNSVWTDIGETLTAGQSDCPRFSTTYNKIENFNNNQETVVHNSFAANQTFTGGGGAVGAADVVEVWMENAPHNTKSKTWYHPAGNWTEGLPFGTEDLAQNIQQRWTRTVWKQDDETQIYKINPRVAESRVGDASNTKKTTVDYLMQAGSTTASRFGLVSEVKVYDTNQTTVLKRATTDYNWDNAYLARRIIGLPLEQKLYDETDLLMSKVTYAYDADPDGFTGTEQNISSVIQHDNTNYGASFMTGRGNLTSTTRHDVNNGSTVSSSIKYNTAGGVVSQITPGTAAGTTRAVKISYLDSFNDTTTSRNTYAYPTKITDPANNFSQVKYRYDIGANVWAKSPAPAGNTIGKETIRDYDSIGRLLKETLVNNGTYTRYDYSQSDREVHSKVYSTIVDTNNNGADAADEVLSEAFTDGAGRVRQSRTPMSFDTSGNTTTWSGSLIEYDILGQVKRQSVPTEIDSNWNPAGDDQARGWLWTYQKYDWKGRVVRKINTDGADTTALNASDILISYEGCGCAGGQVTTVQGELVPRDDQPTVNARRTQKIYADILGRTYKTEVMGWDGITPYTTTVQVFNGRDQVTQTKQYAGAENPNNTYQQMSVTYDGHGRIKTEQRPEQNANTNITYNYNLDDSISSVIDARNVIENFTYDNRGLVEQISYTIPNPLPPDTLEISASAPVNFLYDDTGNRTQMTDGFGTIAYQYDQLSRLTAETRTFSGANVVAMPNAPLPNNSFKIVYDYHLAGSLKSITDPYGARTDYELDKVGRISQVKGNGFGVNTIIDSVAYRAWGAVKEMVGGNGVSSNLTYNNRLLPETELVRKAGVSPDPAIKKQYQYTPDGSIKFAKDEHYSDFDDSDRSYRYDHVGRLTGAATGTWARGEGATTGTDRTLYKYSFGYNTWGNVTSEHKPVGFMRGQDSIPPETYTYSNNRMTETTASNGVVGRSSFDADGRFTKMDFFSGTVPTYTRQFKYGADGLLSYTTETNNYQHSRWSDGEGQVVKEKVLNYNQDTQTYEEQDEKYYVRSSLFGGDILTEVKKDGGKDKTFIYGFGKVLAVQSQTPFNSSFVNWEHRDMLNSQYIPSYSSNFGGKEELDPMRASIPSPDG
ncbi:MAG: hypothetical protein H0U45_11555, partial [Tatlockia sp.]|nr:hypothetical protein [Tatlockia sp.]